MSTKKEGGDRNHLPPFSTFVVSVIAAKTKGAQAFAIRLYTFCLYAGNLAQNNNPGQ